MRGHLASHHIARTSGLPVGFQRHLAMLYSFCWALAPFRAPSSDVQRDGMHGDPKLVVGLLRLSRLLLLLLVATNCTNRLTHAVFGTRVCDLQVACTLIILRLHPLCLRRGAQQAVIIFSSP